MSDNEHLDMIESWRRKAFKCSRADNLGRLQTELLEIMHAMVATEPHTEMMLLRIRALSLQCSSEMKKDALIATDDERALHYGMIGSICQLLSFLCKEGQQDGNLEGLQDQMINEDSYSSPEDIARLALKKEKAKQMATERRSTSNANPKDLVKKKLMKTVKFDLSLLTDSKYGHKGVYDALSPEEFTMEYYQWEGLEKVLIFDCKPEEIGMKIPPKSFTPRNVMERVGENRMIQYINVANQQSYSNSFKKFVEYYEEPVEERAATYNVISLEVSGTEMVDLVKAPELVQQVDLASRWPDARKQRKVVFDKVEGEPTLFSFENKNPRVEHFCLMSASASYTGFHIDFHGSSVWYHVLKGEKVFFIIEPTDENIKKYEKYLLNEDDDTFFGDHVEKCTRVVLKAGNTLILPSGWIHAVYTPVDTLVFGGNFIHPRSLKMQMKIVQHEERLKLQKTEKYPQADEVFLHYMDYVVEKVTGRKHIRPTPRNRQNKGLMYVGEKYLEENRHHIIPTERDFNIRKRNSLVNETIEECPEYEQSREILDHYQDMDFKTLEVDDFRISEDPRIFYHPEHFGVEATLKGNPCGLPLSSKIRGLKMEMDEDILAELIHPSEIVEWEALLEAFLKKKKVNLPEGLTRPNSLVYSFFRLINKRRAMEFERNCLGEASYDVPERTAKLNERWNETIKKIEQIVNVTTIAEPTDKNTTQSQIENAPSISQEAVTEETAPLLAVSLFAKETPRRSTAKKNKSTKVEKSAATMAVSTPQSTPRRFVETSVTPATPSVSVKDEVAPSPYGPSPPSTPKNVNRRSQAVPKLLNLDDSFNDSESPSIFSPDTKKARLSKMPAGNAPSISTNEFIPSSRSTAATMPAGIGSRVQHRKSAPNAIASAASKTESRRRSVAVGKHDSVKDEPDTKKARLSKTSAVNAPSISRNEFIPSSSQNTSVLSVKKNIPAQKSVPRLTDASSTSDPAYNTSTIRRSVPFGSLGSVIGIKPPALTPYSPSARAVSKPATSVTSKASPKPSTTSKSRRSAALAAAAAIADSSNTNDDVFEEEEEEVVLREDPQLQGQYEDDSDYDEDVKEDEEEEEEDDDYKPDFYERAAPGIPTPVIAPTIRAPSVLWSDEEVKILMKCCMKVMLNQSDLSSPIPLWTSPANIAEIRKQLPHRTAQSVKHKILKMKNTPPVIKMLDDFQNGTLILPDANNN